MSGDVVNNAATSWRTKAIVGVVVFAISLGGLVGLQGYLGVKVEPRVVKVDLVVREAEVTVAQGDTRMMWTFNGTVPGPVVHVTQGDVVEFTLTNPASNHYTHSVDFHAAKVAWDKGYKNVMPGDSFTYRFRAKYPGVFMYHCGSGPVLQHIAMGMYGMIIVHPKVLLPSAREYYIVQSEIYDIDLGDPADASDDNYSSAMAVDPRYVVFDGYALKYVEEPLPARVGEMVRVYFLNAGPTLNSAFHVIGTVFDAAYIDGNRANVLKGLQTIDVPPSGGAIMEFTFDEPGNNPFVTHAFAHASRGAVGIFNVTGESITGTVPPPTQVTTIRMVQGATYKTTDAYAPSPAIVKVGVNNTILFINDDVDIHTATVDQRPGVPASPEYFDTGLLSKGESKTITLTKPGTYYYYCLLHPAMVGTIQVLPADSH